MTDLAITLLKKLLNDAEKSTAGVRMRAASITTSALRPYHTNRNVKDREAFEAYMQAAQDNGAIRITREHGYGTEGRIERIDLADITKLSCFLDVPTHSNLISIAEKALSDFKEEFQVLEDVLGRWRQFKKVRSTTPDDVADWVNAGKLIRHLRAQPEISKGELPIREVSAYLFKDSKVIEKLANIVDVLLCGNVDMNSREPHEVWSEIGLCREEHPVRLAGNILLRRERVCALLDIPYTAFPASTVLGTETCPYTIITIENQTTFHSEAKRRYQENILLIYSAGMPSPAWQAMYMRILFSVTPQTSVEHWGDIDEGGFRIAAKIAELALTCGFTLKPHRMSPNDVPLEKRRVATEKTLRQMRQYAEKAGWLALAGEIFESGFTVEQEAL